MVVKRMLNNVHLLDVSGMGVWGMGMGLRGHRSSAITDNQGKIDTQENLDTSDAWFNTYFCFLLIIKPSIFENTREM